MAACAALTFFLACLAAFLLALASFRARLSTVLARRTCCFAVSARAAACTASDCSRCAAAASFARFVEAGVATVRSRLKKWRGAELSPGGPACHLASRSTTRRRELEVTCLRYGKTRNRKLR